MPTEGLPLPDEFPYLLRDHEQRLDEIEKYQPAVMSVRLETLTREVRGMKNAMFTVGGGLLLLAVTIAFSFH